MRLRSYYVCLLTFPTTTQHTGRNNWIRSSECSILTFVNKTITYPNESLSPLLLTLEVLFVSLLAFADSPDVRDWTKQTIRYHIHSTLHFLQNTFNFTSALLSQFTNKPLCYFYCELRSLETYIHFSYN